VRGQRETWKESRQANKTSMSHSFFRNYLSSPKSARQPKPPKNLRIETKLVVREEETDMHGCFFPQTEKHKKTTGRDLFEECRAPSHLNAAKLRLYNQKGAFNASRGLFKSKKRMLNERLVHLEEVSSKIKEKCNTRGEC
jgi:hypothetical protein